MKIKILAVVLLLFPAVVFSQNVNGSLTASLYSLERFTDTTDSETYFRNYETLTLNVNKNQFSLRTRTTFASNLSNTFESDPRLRFYHLYVEGRDLWDIATIKLGRQPYFSSLAGGIYDGASLRLKYEGYSLSGFFGGNVPAYQKLEVTEDWEDDYLLGVKFEINSLEDFRFALNYIDKNFKSRNYLAERLDEELNPVTLLIQSKSNQYKYVSAEADYIRENLFRVDVQYDYDLNYNATSKVEFHGRYDQVDKLGVNVFYNYREPRIRYNSIFSVFDFANTHEVEGGVDYEFTDKITGFAKYGIVTYDDDNSQRVTAGAKTNYGTVSYRKTFGYAGELDAVSLYTAKTFLKGLITPSVGVAYTSYKLTEEDDRNSLITLLGGVNYRPIREVSFDLQGQFLHNKIYDNDARVLFKVSYWFNNNLNLM